MSEAVRACTGLAHGRQRLYEDFVDELYVVNRQLAPELWRQVFVDVLLVLFRQNHFTDSHAARGQHLFLDAADRQHTARQA